jgi:hypothetical protein
MTQALDALMNNKEKKEKKPSNDFCICLLVTCAF